MGKVQEGRIVCTQMQEGEAGGVRPEPAPAAPAHRRLELRRRGPEDEEDDEEEAYQEIYRKMNLPKTQAQKQEQADYDAGTKKLGEFLLMGYTMLEHSCSGRACSPRLPATLHGRPPRQGVSASPATSS
jgi:hypothetical protein